MGDPDQACHPDCSKTSCSDEEMHIINNHCSAQDDDDHGYGHSYGHGDGDGGNDGPPACIADCGEMICSDGGVHPECTSSFETCSPEDKELITGHCGGQGGDNDHQHDGP